jgi:hypothetical protein
VNAHGGLCDMIENGKRITRQTFCRNVDKSDREQVEHDFGYPMGKLTIARDFAVSYEKGKLHGRPAYWINHSAIEYVFYNG